MSNEHPRGPILALDHGDRRIGLAIGGEEGAFAVPLATLAVRNRRQAVEKVLTVVRERRPVLLVVGHPLNMDGGGGVRARKAEAFAAALAAASGLPVTLVDERLSTARAAELLRETDLAPARRRKVVDQVAAVVILEQYLAGRGPRP